MSVPRPSDTGYAASYLIPFPLGGSCRDSALILQMAVIPGRQQSCMKGGN